MKLFLDEQEKQLKAVCKQRPTIHKIQWAKLYPSESARVENFDITLLYFLLFEACPLPKPFKGYSEMPDPNRMAKEDDILRIKLYRNELLHLDASSNFENMWNELKNAICRLGGEKLRTEIDEILLEECLDMKMKEKYEILLESWREEEEARVKTVEGIKKDLNKTETKVLNQISGVEETLGQKVDARAAELSGVVETAEGKIQGKIDHVKHVLVNQQKETSSKLDETVLKYQQKSEAKLDQTIESYRKLLLNKTQIGESSSKAIDKILRDLQQDMKKDMKEDVQSMKVAVESNLKTDMTSLCDRIKQNSTTATEIQNAMNRLEKKVEDVCTEAVQRAVEYHSRHSDDKVDKIMVEIENIKQKLDQKTMDRRQDESRQAQETISVCSAEECPKSTSLQEGLLKEFKKSVQDEHMEINKTLQRTKRELQDTTRNEIESLKNDVVQSIQTSLQTQGSSDSRNRHTGSGNQLQDMVVHLFVALVFAALVYFIWNLPYIIVQEQLPGDIQNKIENTFQRFTNLQNESLQCMKTDLETQVTTGIIRIQTILATDCKERENVLQLIEECATAAADIIFLIDSSRSVKQRNFDKTKDFVSKFVALLDVNKKNVQLGLVTFSIGQHVHFHLKDYQTSHDVLLAVGRVEYENGRGTSIGDALTYVRTECFTYNKGARTSVPKTLILMTDGHDSKDVTVPSQDLRNDGVTVVCIGIGDDFNNEQLNKISSDQSLVFNVNSFDDLPTIKETVVKKVCTKKTDEV